MGYDKKKLASLLRIIYDNTTTDTANIQGHDRLMVIGGRGSKVSFNSPKGAFEGTISDSAGPTIVIRADGLTSFEEFLDEVTKDEEFKEFVGRDAIAKHVKSFCSQPKASCPRSQRTRSSDSRS